MSHADNNDQQPDRDRPALARAIGSASEKPYDPLDCLEKEVERFMRTNLFTPMDVTGFYMQARCVITELHALRKENEYLRNVRERQTDAIMQRDRDIITLEEKVIALQTVVDEAAQCFYGPDEQVPETWGFEVATKLQQLSSPNHTIGHTEQ